VSPDRIPSSWRTRGVRLNPNRALAGVREIMEGGNPHEHNLAEAIAIAQGEIVIYPKAQSPPSADSSD